MSISLDYANTFQLSAADKCQICALFERVFGKTKSLAQFSHQCENTILGYSFHALMRSRDTIVGVYTHIPFEYRFGDRRHLFALSVDTMIAPDHRGHPMNLVRMANYVHEAEIAAGIPFVFGFPNETSYLFTKRAFKWRDVGTLDYYLLPIRVSSYDIRLLPLDIITRALSWGVNLFVQTEDAKEPNASDNRILLIEKSNSAAFHKYRYNLFPVDYRSISLGFDTYCTYVLKPHYPIHPLLDKLKVGFILDVYPLRKAAFERAVRHLYRDEPGLDLIVFVGKLPFTLRNMFKLPKRYEPRQFRMAGRVLIEGVLDEQALFDINCWNVNLSNFDLL